MRLTAAGLLPSAPPRRSHTRFARNARIAAEPNVTVANPSAIADGAATNQRTAPKTAAAANNIAPANPGGPGHRHHASPANATQPSRKIPNAAGRSGSAANHAIAVNTQTPPAAPGTTDPGRHSSQ